MDQIRRPARSGTDFNETTRKAVSSPHAPDQPKDTSPIRNRPEKRAFDSILFPESRNYAAPKKAVEPECFQDLNLDQVIERIVAGREEYDLKGYFRTSLTTIDDIAYRHEIMHDLEDKALRSHLSTFAESMRKMRGYLAQAEKLRFRLQQESWFLLAVDLYCNAAAALADGLSKTDLKSRGLSAFRAYLQDYLGSERFISLKDRKEALDRDLATVRYCVFIAGDGFKVHKYRDEADYTAEIEAVFAKFRQGDAKDYRSKINEWAEMNHIEEKILEFVSGLWLEIFGRLNTFFTAERQAYLDFRLAAFDRQIQFYLAYIDFTDRLKKVDLPVCYPVVSADDKTVRAVDGFDIALAAKLADEKIRVVSNNFELSGKERILVVSGPNQGGKTTFSRTFGQMHYLASLGLPVPGKEARLFLYDTIFTHFEREEDIANLRGKLQDDLVRVRGILERATPQSIIIMNEIFTSTTLQDATFLSEKVMRQILDLDILCVWVTFIHELSTFAEQTVSMVSTVDPGNPDNRTFKVLRQKASGRSYAMSIADKYSLTEKRLRERITS